MSQTINRRWLRGQIEKGNIEARVNLNIARHPGHSVSEGFLPAVIAGQSFEGTVIEFRADDFVGPGHADGDKQG